IANAESAASAAVGKSATIITLDETIITLDDRMQLVASRTIGTHWSCDYCGSARGQPEPSTAPGFDPAMLRPEPILGAGTGGADYTLTAILAYPDGRRVTLGPWGEGKHWNAKTCEREAERARLQLRETLSIARLLSAECTAAYI